MSMRLDRFDITVENVKLILQEDNSFTVIKEISFPDVDGNIHYGEVLFENLKLQNNKIDLLSLLIDSSNVKMSVSLIKKEI